MASRYKSGNGNKANMPLNRDTNNRVICEKKAVWEYVQNLWINRNRMVHGETGTSYKWITHLQEKAHTLKRGEPVIGYRATHLLTVKIDKLKYAELTIWINRINDDFSEKSSNNEYIHL